MPIQIDRMDTSVEITPTAASDAGRERRPVASEAEMQSALRDVVGKLMTEELERFMRNRGM